MRPLIALLFAVLAVTACRTKDKEKPGKGGSAVVTVYPQHHEVAKNLVNFKVYVKYGTSDVPSSGVYDDSMVCTNRDNLVSCTFTGLQNGNYYFYSAGYDTSVKQNLKGGLPYTITSQAAQSFDVPVTE